MKINKRGSACGLRLWQDRSYLIFGNRQRLAVSLGATGVAQRLADDNGQLHTFIFGQLSRATRCRSLRKIR